MATYNAINNVTNFRQGFCAYKSSTTDNVTGDSTAYTIVFDTELYDRGGVYDHTNGIFTAPVTGFYYLQVCALISGINSGSTTGALKLISTPKTIIVQQVNPYFSRSSAGSFSMKGSLIMYLSATDTVYATITLTDGTKVTDLNGSATSMFTCFSAIRLG